MEYLCAEFGVDSSSRFPLRARTHTQTDTHTESQTPLVTLATQWLRRRGITGCYTVLIATGRIAAALIVELYWPDGARMYQHLAHASLSPQ